MAGNKISNGLIALSSAAILAVYAAGYDRTSEAAKKFSEQDQRVPVAPVKSSFVSPAQALPPLVPGEPPFITVPSAAGEPGVPAAPTREVPIAADPVVPPAAPAAGESVSSALANPAAAPVAVSSNSETVPVPSSEPAPASAPATAAVVVTPVAADTVPVVPAPVNLYKDGTYSAWGSCRHGDLEATIVIDGGRIASATISQCYTRYPCSWISNAPGQVVSRQSIDVDYVSGATQSINAFRDAVYQALAKAK